MIRTDDIEIFCSELWSWFSIHKRTLPWRDLTEKDPSHKAYLILVSEVMLQQTQVSRVVILYKKFIHTFPCIGDLAKASNREILIAWRGMGYNSRALRLRDAARTLTPSPSPGGRGGAQGEKRSWEFPSSMEELQSIPGIGHYTAAAIRNFAFNLPTPCLDTNIRRILHRFFVGMENEDGTWKKDDRYLLKVAEKVLEEALGLKKSKVGKVRHVRTVGKTTALISPEFFLAPPTLPTIPILRTLPKTSDWHAALMDFGSLVVTKNNPKWDLLPVGMRSICKAYGKQKVRIKNVFKKEPGREIGGRFIPNRIFRGRIVEELRDHPKGLSSEEIGKRVAIDWTMGDHRKWLTSLLHKLSADQLIAADGGKFRLRE